jgi:hypothetical protein
MSLLEKGIFAKEEFFEMVLLVGQGIKMRKESNQYEVYINIYSGVWDHFVISFYLRHRAHRASCIR